MGTPTRGRRDNPGGRGAWVQLDAVRFEEDIRRDPWLLGAALGERQNYSHCPGLAQKELIDCLAPDRRESSALGVYMRKQQRGADIDPVAMYRLAVAWRVTENISNAVAAADRNHSCLPEMLSTLDCRSESLSHGI